MFSEVASIFFLTCICTERLSNLLKFPHLLSGDRAIRSLVLDPVILSTLLDCLFEGNGVSFFEAQNGAVKSRFAQASISQSKAVTLQTGQAPKPEMGAQG